MGQSYSSSIGTTHTDSVPFPSRRKTKSTRSSNLDDQNYSSNQASQCCCLFQMSLNPSYDDIWKKQMEHRLRGLDLATWPKILIRCLKRPKAVSSADIYRSDVLWVYQNHLSSRRESCLIQSILTQHKDSIYLDESFSDSGNVNMGSLIQPSDSKIMDETVQSLLDNSHIFDEKFYGDNQKETWMNKSFNIIVPDETPRTKKIVSSKATDKNFGYTSRRVEKYKNNTFVNQIPTDENEILIQEILKYKSVTDIIDKHIKQKKNIFYQLIHQFEHYYIQTYQPVLQKYKRKELSMAHLKECSQKATADLQQFVRIIFEGIQSFYKLDTIDNEKISQRECLFNRDNLISLTNCLVFTDSVSKIIFEFYKIEEAELETAYEKMSTQWKYLNPEDFEVPDEFCLNERTIKYFSSKGLFKEPTCEDLGSLLSLEKNKNIPFCSEASTKITLDGNYSNSDEETPFEAPRISEVAYKSATPYEEAIQTLSSLKYQKSPIHKLKTIVKVASLISKSIESFYGEQGVSQKKKIDADQTFSIFLYILSKSRLNNVFAHCRIVKSFSTNNILNSISGYYMVTLEACASHLCSQEQKK